MYLVSLDRNGSHRTPQSCIPPPQLQNSGAHGRHGTSAGSARGAGSQRGAPHGGGSALPTLPCAYAPRPPRSREPTGTAAQRHADDGPPPGSPPPTPARKRVAADPAEPPPPCPQHYPEESDGGAGGGSFAPEKGRRSRTCVHEGGGEDAAAAAAACRRPCQRPAPGGTGGRVRGQTLPGGGRGLGADPPPPRPRPPSLPCSLHLPAGLQPAPAGFPATVGWRAAAPAAASRRVCPATALSAGRHGRVATMGGGGRGGGGGGAAVTVAGVAL